MRNREAAGDGCPAGTILILSSSMGAGHDAVSIELARRLRDRGFDPQVMDMVKVLPLGFGRLMRGFYAFIIRWLPWLYEWIYRTWLQPAPGERGTVSPVTVLLERKILQWCEIHHPVAVVSTFHVCTQALGAMRAQGMITVPTVNVIVDFDVHGLWVHPYVDLNLCLHKSCAEQVREHLEALGVEDAGSRVVPVGPTVRRQFLSDEGDRIADRIGLGVEEGALVILVVGGSWGSGDLVRTLRTVLSVDAHHVPVVVCGENRRLLRRVRHLCRRTGRGVAFGWVNDLWRLMHMADVLVENAGGLTAMEAMAAQLPVVSYSPIPGHGRSNVEAMASNGVSLYARSPGDLRRCLDLTANRDRGALIATAAAMFRGDAAEEISARLEGRR